MRKIGKFRVSQLLAYEEDFYKVLCSMCFVPLKVDFDLILNIFTYTGMSPLFNALPDGEEIPEYKIDIIKKNDNFEVTTREILCGRTD